MAYRILITGASGFIGQHLLKRLLKRDAEVFVAGRTPPIPPPDADATRLTFLRCDFTNEVSFQPHREIFRQVNSVVHLGAVMLRSSNPADDDAIFSMRVNVEGTARLLRYLSADLESFCCISTVDVYGPPQFVPVTEEHPTRPMSYYGASKLAAEAVVGVFGERSEVPVTTLRLSQVYGPGDNSRKAIPNFTRAALRGEGLVIDGDGTDERDYVFIADVVEAVELSLLRRTAGTFNIAGGRGCSIGEVVTNIARLTGSTSAPIWKPRAIAPTRIVLDIARAEKQLGYCPRVNLEEGLRRTVDWFRQNPATA